ncbi:MAG: diguanylate cyclase [Candidatus Izemoplasma sp.]|nr:diguanylate cyclase [Candidatus Izemoplasma sp.]
MVHKEVQKINNAQLNIKQLREYDTLTNVHNRSSYNEKVKELSMTGETVSIILSDINGLKLINEMYSSYEGDNTLINYANMLRDIVEDDAFIARIGGDEFCLFINGYNEDRLVNYVQEIKTKIIKERIFDLPLTVAIGYASTEETTNIHEALSIAEDRMLNNKLILQESASSSIVKSLKTALFERSDETEQHANRIADLCVQLGQRIGLSHNELNDLKLFAILHDVGKIGIEDKILKKPSRLNESEYKRMKQHPSIGYKIASNVEALEGISYYILTHHEWWDGNGYPKGLKDEEIPLLSRILSIVDAWDAMTNDRIYRNAMSKENAIQELIDYKGTQFGPMLIEEFLNIVNSKR